MSQPDLFGTPLPGLSFWPDALSEREERALLPRLSALPFAPFRFQGWTGNRRTVSFGWHYDFDEARFAETVPIPDFLRPVRDRAAALAGIAPEALPHMLVTEYRPGAGIGWHRDRPVFDLVIGFSLLSPCTLRSAAAPRRASSVRSSRCRPAPPICSPAPRGSNGSTASPRWTCCATRSPAGACGGDAKLLSFPRKRNPAGVRQTRRMRRDCSGSPLSRG